MTECFSLWKTGEDQRNTVKKGPSTVQKLEFIVVSSAVVLVGPVKYQTKFIYVFNIIGFFFYLLFLFSQLARTRREFTGGNSEPILNKNLNYEIKLNHKLFLIR